MLFERMIRENNSKQTIVDENSTKLFSFLTSEYRKVQLRAEHQR